MQLTLQLTALYLAQPYTLPHAACAANLLPSNWYSPVHHLKQTVLQLTALWCSSTLSFVQPDCGLLHTNRRNTVLCLMQPVLQLTTHYLVQSYTLPHAVCDATHYTLSGTALYPTSCSLCLQLTTLYLVQPCALPHAACAATYCTLIGTALNSTPCSLCCNSLPSIWCNPTLSLMQPVLQLTALDLVQPYTPPHAASAATYCTLSVVALHSTSCSLCCTYRTISSASMHFPSCSLCCNPLHPIWCIPTLSLKQPVLPCCTLSVAGLHCTSCSQATAGDCLPNPAGTSVKV